MQEIAVLKFKASCLAVLETVRKTRRPVRISRFGKPIAEIVPPSVPDRPPDWRGSFACTGRICWRHRLAGSRRGRVGSPGFLKLLLDTHIWLWSLLQPERLCRRVAREMRRLDNELWHSPISLWELGVLCNKGRVELTQDMETWVEAVFHGVPLREAPLTTEIALAAHGIELPRRDPVERFLAATAERLDLR